MRTYLIVGDDKSGTIRVTFDLGRIRVRIDKDKWTVKTHSADSGSIIGVTLRPKEEAEV